MGRVRQAPSPCTVAGMTQIPLERGVPSRASIATLQRMLLVWYVHYLRTGNLVDRASAYLYAAVVSERRAARR